MSSARVLVHVAMVTEFVSDLESTPKNRFKLDLGCDQGGHPVPLCLRYKTNPRFLGNRDCHVDWYLCSRCATTGLYGPPMQTLRGYPTGTHLFSCATANGGRIPMRGIPCPVRISYDPIVLPLPPPILYYAAGPPTPHAAGA